MVQSHTQQQCRIPTRQPHQLRRMESSSTAQNSSFSSSSECELLGIIYSEFDNEVGPRLVFQYPSNIMTPKIFETLSDYIIVGKHLCEKIMIIRYENQQIVNYSVAIENSKYGRNTLSFALGFILQETVDTVRLNLVIILFLIIRNLMKLF